MELIILFHWRLDLVKLASGGIKFEVQIYNDIKYE